MVVMSDHGAGPLYGILHLNKWLCDHGYLVLRKGSRKWLKRRLYESRFLQLCSAIARHIQLNRVVHITQQAQMVLASGILTTEDIDWEKTRAYNMGFEGALYVLGSDPEGTMAQLSQELGQLRDPGSGQTIVEQVLRGRELYHGSRADYAPDLVLRLRDNAYIADALQWVAPRCSSVL